MTDRNTWECDKLGEWMDGRKRMHWNSVPANRPPLQATHLSKKNPAMSTIEAPAIAFIFLGIMPKKDACILKRIEPEPLIRAREAHNVGGGVALGGSLRDAFRLSGERERRAGDRGVGQLSVWAAHAKQHTRKMQAFQAFVK